MKVKGVGNLRRHRHQRILRKTSALRTQRYVATGERPGEYPYPPKRSHHRKPS